MAIQKKSRKRDAILACVCSTDTHPTAEWVYTRLKPDIPDLSLGTVLCFCLQSARHYSC